LPAPTVKPENANEVTVDSPQHCKICSPADPAGAKGFSNGKTGMKNKRQEVIFWHLMDNYKVQQYDCCYVFNEKFHKAVDQFDFPASVNLINSDRLLDLNLEIRKLNPSMKLEEIRSAKIIDFLTKLEPLDWTFLRDSVLSKPFWDALKTSAPPFVYTAVQGLVTKSAKNPVSGADIEKALSK
jgi:hypothetical protein